MEAMLGNPSQMAQMHDRESAGEYVGSSLGQGLLAVSSAIEYMIFEPSSESVAVTSPRPGSGLHRMNCIILPPLPMICATVACVLIGFVGRSWHCVGRKLSILDDAELSYDRNYGAYMKNAGKVGSMYVSYAQAVEELIVGAQDIADEVGNQKIGNPVGSGRRRIRII